MKTGCDWSVNVTLKACVDGIPRGVDKARDQAPGRVGGERVMPAGRPVPNVRLMVPVYAVMKPPAVGGARRQTPRS